eukprot:13721036-Ditylum_brightwellii.AAC.1
MFQACAPTVTDEDHDHVPQNFNFEFDMEMEGFTGKIKKNKLPQEGKPFERFCMAEWVTFLDMNASLYTAGNMIYDTFTKFTPQEIEKHIGVYILNRLSSSAYIKIKLQPQKLNK